MLVSRTKRTAAAVGADEGGGRGNVGSTENGSTGESSR